MVLESDHAVSTPALARGQTCPDRADRFDRAAMNASMDNAIGLVMPLVDNVLADNLFSGHFHDPETHLLVPV